VKLTDTWLRSPGGTGQSRSVVRRLALLVVVVVFGAVLGCGGGSQPGGTRGGVQAWGRDVTVDHAVGGSVRVSNGSVVVNGSVDGEVRVWNGDLHVNGQVGGDVRVSQGTFTLARNAGVGGSVYVFNHGQNVQMDGRVSGDLRASGSPTVVLGQGSSVRNVTVWGGSLDRQDGSQVSGSVQVYR
jgi:cytoskeletal protein CcmA (bactofilin family)